MTWYVYCYYGYKLREHGSFGVINTRHLSFVEFDPEKRYDVYKRHMITSVHPVPGSTSMHYGCYMNMDEIVPVQFYPKPLSLGRFFGLEWDPKRIDPNLWALITCKTDKDPRRRY